MTSKHLLELLDRIGGVSALVIGDIMLDRYIIGSVDRVSDEAPVPIVAVKRTDERLGGASNTAANLRAIEAKVAFCGVVGDDAEGRRVKALLEENLIDTAGLITDPARSTILKTRILARNQQVVRVDWEDSSQIQGAVEEQLVAYLEANVEKFNLLIVADYGKGTLTERFFLVLDKLMNSGKLGLKNRPVAIDPHPRNYNLYSGKHFNIVKPNLREAERAAEMAIVTPDDAKIAGRIIRERWGAEIVALSMGEQGLLVSTASQDLLTPTQARSVYDVSGAGDTVTAVFSASIAAGASLEDAATLANIAAGIVVSEVGTVPVRRDRLVSELTDSPY